MKATPFCPAFFFLMAGILPIHQGHAGEVANDGSQEMSMDAQLAPAPHATAADSEKNFLKDLQLDGVGIRFATNEGDNLKSDLRLYDVFAAYRLPWSRPLSAGIDLETRFTASIGLLEGTKTSLYASLAPGIGITDSGRKIFLEMAAGIALVPNYTLGPEDFGGPVQFTLDAGLSWRFYKNISLGYRYYHFSDAGIFGSDNRGVDMHMLELTSRYPSR